MKVGSTRASKTASPMLAAPKGVAPAKKKVGDQKTTYRSTTWGLIGVGFPVEDLRSPSFIRRRSTPSSTG
eukprot:2636911-Pleurochrysis_carterae.AAC.2